MTPERNQTTTGPISQQALAALGGPNLVYVRPLRRDELAQLPDIDVAELDAASLGPDGGASLHAIHGADGGRLALVSGGRAAAFVAARQNDRDPVSVH